MVAVQSFPEPGPSARLRRSAGLTFMDCGGSLTFTGAVGGPARLLDSSE
jgi:hypothetical protein